METIDITPTWEETTKMFLVVLQSHLKDNKNAVAGFEAMKPELLRMAKIADKYVRHQKEQIGEKKSIAIGDLKRAAKGLVDDGNTEYTRGICELIADFDGKEDVPHAERAIEIARELGISDNVVTKFY